MFALGLSHIAAWLHVFSHQQTNLERAEQEAVTLDKQQGFELLAKCSKAISDATYLDELGKSHRFYEKLSWADKREINRRALVYAQRVCRSCI